LRIEDRGSKIEDGDLRSSILGILDDLTKHSRWSIITGDEHGQYVLTQAEVAELADALRSGRSGGNLVGVQISPSAPSS
jgi:hypothetical protein